MSVQITTDYFMVLFIALLFYGESVEARRQVCSYGPEEGIEEAAGEILLSFLSIPGG